ncbi:porin [Paraburkholderia sediminicola]|uniref:porin n=1 Tax=Paraburkholderia sediminicola TaxID=458836 RepID=UPI0038B83CF4
MRITKLIVVMPLAISVPAFCQSSVTLSGTLDAGISYVSNEGGHGNAKFDDGIARPNTLNISGREDLGGGVVAIFKLTDQFMLGSGSIVPGQSLFSRTALVGVESAQYGRLTMGNQFDFMNESLLFGGNDGGAEYIGGLYDFRNGPFNKLALPNNPTGSFEWDRLSEDLVENSVKYVSPDYNGLSAGAMYGFGGVAGSLGSNNSASFGLNYANGPFGMAAAYTNTKSDVAGAQASVRNWGVGAHYKFDSVVATVLFTTVHNSANGGGVYQGEVAAVYHFDAFWALGAAYSYMKGNSVVDNNHANQVSSSVSYALSKRSVLYVSAVYQRTNSGANALINGVLDPDGASSGPSQFIGRVGFVTNF